MDSDRDFLGNRGVVALKSRVPTFWDMAVDRDFLSNRGVGHFFRVRDIKKIEKIGPLPYPLKNTKNYSKW